MEMIEIELTRADMPNMPQNVCINMGVTWAPAPTIRTSLRPTVVRVTFPGNSNGGVHDYSLPLNTCQIAPLICTLLGFEAAHCDPNAPPIDAACMRQLDELMASYNSQHPQDVRFSVGAVYAYHCVIGILASLNATDELVFPERGGLRSDVELRVLATVQARVTNAHEATAFDMWRLMRKQTDFPYTVGRVLGMMAAYGEGVRIFQ